MKGSGYVTEESKAIVSLWSGNSNTGTKGPVTEAADVADNVYSDGKTTDFAIEQIRRLKDKPFFVALGLRKPHLPFTAPKKYWDMYDPDDFKLVDIVITLNADNIDTNKNLCVNVKLKTSARYKDIIFHIPNHIGAIKV